MLIVLFIIILALFFGVDSNFEIGNMFIILAAEIVIAGIAHIITLTAAVSNDAKKKKLGARIIWTILTFLFGLPAGLFYALFTFKAGKYEDKKSNQKNLILVIIALILMLAFTVSTVNFVTGRQEYETTHFSKDMITYKNSDGEDVVYDRMGIAYTRQEYENFRYYDCDGNTYIPVFSYDVFSNVPEIYGVEGAETNKKTTEFDQCDFLIDRNGYLVIVPDNKLNYSSLGVAYDNEQNIYYYISTVYWTPDGDLTFTNEDDLGKITYQDITIQEEQDYITSRDNDITDFFGFFERSDWEYMPYHCTENFWAEYFDGTSLSGIVSAELIEITEQGIAYNDENRYYVIANAKCKSAKNSMNYDKESRYKTLKLKVVFDYDEDYSEWKASEMKILT